MHVFLDEISVSLKDDFQKDSKKLRRQIFGELQRLPFRCLEAYPCCVCLSVGLLWGLATHPKETSIVAEPALFAVRLFLARCFLLPL